MLGVEEEEVGRMVLVDVQQKELGVALMKAGLKEQEAEAGVAQVESLVETEVNNPLSHSKLCVMHLPAVHLLASIPQIYHERVKEVPSIMLLFSPTWAFDGPKIS